MATEIKILKEMKNYNICRLIFQNTIPYDLRILIGINA